MDTMSENQKVNRRNFLKIGGLAAMTLPAITVVGKSGDQEFVSSPEAYGEHLVRRQSSGHASEHRIDPEVFERFDQVNEAFNRAMWDEDFQKTFPPDGDFGNVAEPTKPGYRREDLALSDAAWTIAGAFGTGSGMNGYHQGLYSLENLEGPEPAEPWDHSYLTPEEITQRVKTAALFFGASLVGVTELDEKWLYSRYSSMDETVRQGDVRYVEAEKAEYLEDGTLVIPRSLNKCVVMAYEMDHDGYRLSPGANASAATGNGYSRMAFTGASLAQFIRYLGYNAVPCGNNTGLSVPMAIDAGLGEKSRMGCLVTPKYGPRVRLNKVFTDMPLQSDVPISFGVTEFCEVCRKCAENCPSGAITHGEQSHTSNNISNIQGVYKWQNDMEKCFRFWMENGTDCSICLGICPFNKQEGWLHEATRILIGAQSGSLDKLLVRLDEASGFGQLPSDDEALAFWEKKDFIHIKP
jgi:epoxyqueuosine reductase